jgi:anti-sigma B factor antagonist
MGDEPNAFAVDVLSPDSSFPVIVVSGEVDLLTAPDLAECIEKIIARAPRDLVIDLTQASFLDCSGVSVILSARRDLSDASRIVIRQPRPFIRKILGITQVDAVCHIED